MCDRESEKQKGKKQTNNLNYNKRPCMRYENPVNYNIDKQHRSSRYYLAHLSGDFVRYKVLCHQFGKEYSKRDTS